MKNDKAVKVGGRAFDILLALTERAGEVVGQKELIARAWPNVFVEDVSLRFHIAGLRKALGCDGTRYLANVPGRGYSLIAPVSRALASDSLGSDTAIAPAYPLPPQLAGIVGREEDAHEISDKLLSGRFVTIVGPGGVGKTTAALSVAHMLLEEFLGTVCFVELSPVGSSRVLATTVTAAFRLSVRAEDPIPELIAHLRNKRVLLVLDGCEHLIAASATVAERLLGGVPNLHILATSREALRAEGEHVHLLPPLASPPEKEALTKDQALAYPAAQLFFDRVVTAGFTRAPSNEEARIVGGMCRQLGGIALAIELAAGRAASHGIRDTASLLDSQFALLWPGRRTAPARHQTLTATLDWSHGLLSDAERIAFRQLSTFVGSFTLEAAERVIGGDLEAEQVGAAFGGLCEKFLVATDASGPVTRYRLLDTTRAYAALKLRQADERHALQQRHAIYYRDLMVQTARGDEVTHPLAAEIDNIRAALHWSFGPKGDADLGVQLAASSATTWLALGLLTECHDWMTIASKALDDTRAPRPEQLGIYMALASTLLFTASAIEEFEPVWHKAFGLAVSLGDVESQMSCHLALWARQIRVPLYAASLATAEECFRTAGHSENPGAVGQAEWMLGQSKLFLARLEEAAGHFRRFIELDTQASRMAMMKQTGYDRLSDGLGCSSCLSWLRGFPEQALRTGRKAVSSAESLEFPLPVAVASMWCGFVRYFLEPDMDKIEADMMELLEHSETHEIPQCQGFGLCILGLCQARRGQFEEAHRLIEEGLRLQAASHYHVFHPIIRTEFSEAAAGQGRVDDAEWLLRRNDEDDVNAEHWCTPEILRVKGVVAEAVGDADAGLDFYRRAAALAHRQGALSWELRSAMSLGRYYAARQREEEALRTLEAVYGRYTEGFGGPDLTRAKRLIDDLKVMMNGSSPGKAPGAHR
jgi:predicted ATPase